MDTQALFTMLSSHQPLSDQFKQAVEAELISLQLPKNYILVRPDAISTQLYFLNSGFVMSYRYVDGRKVTEKFWKPGQLIISFESFFQQKPSHEYLELVVESELLAISHESLQRLLQTLREASMIYQGVMTQHYAFSLKRIQEGLRLDAQARFENMLKTFSGIEQLVSQDCIASYLGITAQSLSRLKRTRGRGH